MKWSSPGSGRWPGIIRGRAYRRSSPADVALIYWTAVSWAAAISVTKDNSDLIADLPVIEALIDRALELDEAFDSGTVHSFLIAYEMNRETASGRPRGESQEPLPTGDGVFGRTPLGPRVTLAESVSLPKQDKAEFQRLLQQALEINPDDQTGVASGQHHDAAAGAVASEQDGQTICRLRRPRESNFDNRGRKHEKRRRGTSKEGGCGLTIAIFFAAGSAFAGDQALEIRMVTLAPMGTSPHVELLKMGKSMAKGIGGKGQAERHCELPGRRRGLPSSIRCAWVEWMHRF